MAVVQNTLIGRARGRVGNAVFRTHKGQNVLSQKPEVVANPRSAQQQANRSRFNALLALGRVLRPLIALGFKEYAGVMSWLNKFMSTNSYTGMLVWDSVNSVWEIDYRYLVTAEGSLMQQPIGSGGIVGNVLTIGWDPTLIANQNPLDKLCLVAFRDNGIETQFFIRAEDRSAGTFDITFDSLTIGDKVTVSAFFISPDGLIVSNSYCFEAEKTA